MSGVPGIKVSVATTTYNHESYIGAAIESVMAQVCDFDFEFIIADDCSTDRTREVLQEYAEQHPGRITLILREKNIGAQRNFGDVLSRCTGKYVALLDGDDYWTTPHKLQAQVDFLDANPGCTLCFHEVEIIQTDGGMPVAAPAVPPAVRLEIEDLLERNFISACAVMYRWGLVESLPDWWYDRWIGDYPVHIFHAAHGWIGHIPEVMAAYRVHGEGLWSGRKTSARMDEFVHTLTLIDETLGHRYHEAIVRSIRAHREDEFAQRFRAAVTMLENGDVASARRESRWAWAHRDQSGPIGRKAAWILALQAHVPVLVAAAVGVKRTMRRLASRRG